MKIKKVWEQGAKSFLALASTFLLFGLLSCAPELPSALDPLGVTSKGGSGGGGSSNGESGGTVTLYKNDSSLGEKDSIAAALSEIPQSGTDTYKITLAAGRYEENGLTYKGTNTVQIVGLGSKAYGSDVVIYGQGTDMSTESTRALLSFQGAANVVLENLTLQNSYGMTTGTAQAEALGIGPTAFSGTLAAYNCSFLSGQDTICTEGKAWFYKCYVEGDVDFIWMESKSGVVALYEDCEIKAIGSRTKTAYFTAPRLGNGNTVGKGVVIWNSKLEADSALSKVYLGRNPWDKDEDTKKGTNYFENYYEQVAFVGTTLTGKSLESEIWSGSGAHGTENQQFVGFKTDKKFPASSAAATNKSAVLTDAQVADEYNKRTIILNRLYNITTKEFENDSSSKIWDVSSLATQWNAGDSGTLPTATFDATKAKVVWDLASAWTGDDDKDGYQGGSSKYAGSGKIAGAIEGYDGSDYTVKMFADASNSGKFVFSSTRTQMNANTVITVPVTNGAIVSVTKTSGTFGILGETRETYTHSGSATGVAIYCTANGYLTEVTVSKLDLTALSADLLGATATGEVQGISVTPTEKTVMNGSSTSLTAVAYTSYGATAGTISWASDATSVATVDTNGKVSVVASSGTANITASYGSYSAKCVITATATASWSEIASTDYTWDDADTVSTKDNINLNNAKGFWNNMYIDATGGKFASNGGSWIDCQNTTIYVPMTKNGTITINLYQASQYTSVTGGSTALTEDSTNKKYVYSYTTTDAVKGSAIKNGSTIEGIEDDYTYAKIVFANGSGSKYIGDIIRKY